MLVPTLPPLQTGPHRRRGLASDGVRYADARSIVGHRFRSVTKLTTKVRIGRGYLWGSFLIAAAALKTPTRNGYNAQGVNLNFAASDLKASLYTHTHTHTHTCIYVCICVYVSFPYLRSAQRLFNCKSSNRLRPKRPPLSLSLYLSIYLSLALTLYIYAYVASNLPALGPTLPPPRTVELPLT